MTLCRPQLELHRAAACSDLDCGLEQGALRVADAAVDGVHRIDAVVAATFSNPRRFPALAVRLVSELGLDPAIPAIDIQLACSAYPYALFLAASLISPGGYALVVDGDRQSPLVDPCDHATGKIFSDGMSATLVGLSSEGESRFAFLNSYDEALACSSEGPIRMDGFKVFSFVAVKVSKFLKDFLSETPHPDWFVPHQAQPYMIRQLAQSLSLDDRLLALDPKLLNPGSCSIPFAIAASESKVSPGDSCLVAGFGAGYSASAATVRLADDFKGIVL